MHRRRADEASETIGQRRARQADLAAQVIDGPTPGDVAVFRYADVKVAR